MMFGFACNETDVLMPAPIIYAHKLVQRQSELLARKVLPWLRPDGKSQVTLRYVDNKPVAATAIVLSKLLKLSVTFWTSKFPELISLSHA